MKLYIGMISNDMYSGITSCTQNLCWQADIFELDILLVLLSMTMPVCHTLKLQCETNSNDNEKNCICNICSERVSRRYDIVDHHNKCAISSFLQGIPAI